MKKLLSILLCVISMFLIGCEKINEVDAKKDTNMKAENSKYEIRDNYLESIQKQFPEDIYIAGIDLENKPYNAQLGVNYQGDKEKTMMKMAEIFKTSEDFFKTQKVEYVYFETMDNKMNSKGKFTLHLENDKYVVKESTIE